MSRGAIIAAALALALLWGATGVGVYRLLGSHRGKIAERAAKPGEAGAGVNPALARLPGTIYLVQDGALYRLQKGRFTTLLQSGGWGQPSLLPGGQALVLMKRDPSGFSDLYRVDAASGRAQQLTHDQGKGAVQGIDPGGQLVTQYWAMFPRVSADGTQLYFTTDRYKHVRCCPFDVTMRLAQMPITGGTPKFWTVDGVTQTDTHTEDGDYAGGDSRPVPVGTSGLLFVRYAYAGTTVTSQLMLIRQARGAPTELTASMDRCDEPSVSPDGTRVAMICSYGRQVTSLEVASFDGASLGPRQVLVNDVQAAQPVWSPDGTQVLYLAPVGVTGHFQLWSVAAPTTLPTPLPTVKPVGRGRTPAPSPTVQPAAAAPPASAVGPPPVQLTQNLDFDATSPIAWAA